VETVTWRWNEFWRTAIAGFKIGLIFGLIVAFISVLSSFLIGGSIGGRSLFSGVLGFGLTIGLVSGLCGGFTDMVQAEKAFPNQGIKLSQKNSFAVFLCACLTVALIGWLIAGLSGGLSGGLSFALSVGLSFGLIVALNRGGSTVIKHYALRLILWLNGSTPFKFVKFLDQCASLILLKKVGGGYMFIHRMLLDYFADLTPESVRVEDRTAGSK
jgi:hypothetical protein